MALVDIGAESTNVVLSAQNSVWFRSISSGGDAFTTELQRPFRLTYEQAERLKRRPTAARRVSQVYEALSPTLSFLAEEIKRSLEAHGRLLPDVSIRKLYGTGGGSALHGLLRHLRTGS